MTVRLQTMAWALAFVLALAAPLVAATPSPFTDLAPEAFQALAAEPRAMLVDVRTPAEFAEGHIAGSTNLDFQAPDFARKAAGLPRDRALLLSCRSGNRSGKAMELLRGLGFSRVYHLGGGVKAWTAAGLPLTRE